MNSLTFPPYLGEGDRVVIVSPSSKIDKAFLKGAVKRLRSWGLEVVVAHHAASSCGTYAGTIAQRVEDLQAAMDDEGAKVILCSRGGYGAVHLVDKLDFTSFRKHPKWLVGFSDITALHNLMQHEGFASLHAPMARHLTVEPADDPCTLALRDILFGHLTPMISPASSIWLDSCIMAFMPAREANGIYLTVPIRTSRKNVPYSGGMTPCCVENIERYMTLNAMDGIRYGKNARLSTSVASFVPRPLTMP